MNLDYYRYAWVGLGTFYFEESTGFMYRRKMAFGQPYYVPLEYCDRKCSPNLMNVSCRAKIIKLYEKGFRNPNSYVAALYDCGATGTHESLTKVIEKDLQRLNDFVSRREKELGHKFLSDEEIRKFIHGE